MGDDYSFRQWLAADNAAREAARLGDTAGAAYYNQQANQKEAQMFAYQDRVVATQTFVSGSTTGANGWVVAAHNDAKAMGDRDREISQANIAKDAAFDKYWHDQVKAAEGTSRETEVKEAQVRAVKLRGDFLTAEMGDRAREGRGGSFRPFEDTSTDKAMAAMGAPSGSALLAYGGAPGGGAGGGAGGGVPSGTFQATSADGAAKSTPALTRGAAIAAAQGNWVITPTGSYNAPSSTANKPSANASIDAKATPIDADAVSGGNGTLAHQYSHRPTSMGFNPGGMPGFNPGANYGSMMSSIFGMGVGGGGGAFGEVQKQMQAIVDPMVKALEKQLNLAPQQVQQLQQFAQAISNIGANFTDITSGRTTAGNIPGQGGGRTLV